MDFRAVVELLGNLGEFLGSIAVLATLVYLSIQVRQARKLATLNAAQQRADARMSSSLASVDPSKLSELRGRLVEELELHYEGDKTYVQNLQRVISGFSHAEIVMLTAWVNATTTNLMNAVYQMQEGNLEASFELEYELGGVAALAQALWGDPPDDSEFFTMAKSSLAALEASVAAGFERSGRFRSHQTYVLEESGYPTRGTNS